MTTTGTWKTNWLRGGKVTSVAWIGKDVMAWCSGMNIIFYNVKKKQQSIRWCSRPSTGEGASCISGHQTLSIFAYAEKVLNPRILVYSYPSMTKISECTNGIKIGYLATVFAGTDFLVSIGTYTDFTLVIWNWKTGEKLKSISTSIPDPEGQVLQANYRKPILVAQLGRNYGKLCIWEVIAAGKVVILKDHEVVLPKKAVVNDISWSPESGEPLLAITDKDGHIYLSNKDGTNIDRIVVSQRCGICLDIEPAAICWFAGGIVLRTTFCQIRFYEKNKDNAWRRKWYVKTTTKPCVLTSHPFKNDRLFFHTLQGHIMQLSFEKGQETPVIVTRVFYSGVIKHVDFVYPWGHHLVVTDDSMYLAVVDSYSGNEINRFDLDMLGDISYIVSHPDYPMVAASSTQGELVLVSLLEPKNPRLLGRYHLQKDKLNFLKFSQSGRYLVAGEMGYGIFYFVKLSRRKPFAVIGQLKVNNPVLDVVAFEDKDHLMVYVLLRTSDELMMGHAILLYDISPGQNKFEDISSGIELHDTFQHLDYVPGDPSLLIGSPFLTRQVHILKLLDFKEMSLVNAMSSDHQLKSTYIFTDRNWITTCSTDGFVIVRDKTSRASLITLMTHHRMNCGVTKAITKASGEMIIALGHDGSLVSMIYYETETNDTEKINKNCYAIRFDDYANNQAIVEADYASLDSVILDMLSRPLHEFPLFEEREQMTWIEWVEKQKLLEEEKLCAEKKASILSRFNILKAKVVKLMEENDNIPEIERLPLEAFDLDKVSREQKMKAAKDEREDIRLEIEYNCSEMDRVADLIKSKFWDTQATPLKSIFSFSGSTIIENYPLEKVKPYQEEQQKWAVYTRELNNELRGQDSFAPWRLYTPSELNLELQNVNRMQKIDEKKRMDELLDKQDEEVQGVANDEMENFLDCEGTTTHHFVDRCKETFPQFSSYSYSQFLLNNIFLEMDAEKLREYWNNIFNELYESKEREMAQIKEKIDRIKHIDSELKLMFGQSVPEIPVCPEWHLKEVPENILVVFDHEIEAKPYISPSEQEILDQKAAEAERARLLLLADNFREKALDKMMDGVLELLWEDTIKKDIPKPPCMRKSPDQYTAADLEAIKNYEKDVENLAQEREKYKRMLEADYAKVHGSLKEGMEKFDSRLQEAFELKLKIDAAIKQQDFRHVRGCLRNRYCVEAVEKDEKIRADIEQKRRLSTELNDQLKIVQAAIQDLQSQHESLVVKEKALDKKLKSEFPGLGKGAIEALQTQYKRRPRINLKNTFASNLLDLGSSAVALTKPVHLPVECLDYLKGLDFLDVRPGSVPPSVGTNQWGSLVRLRRHKVDIEMKVRAMDLEIKEATQTLSDYNKKINKCRSDINALKEKLNILKQEVIEHDRNMEVQLILQMGQVEIKPPLTRHGTKDCILIPRAEIEAVNKRILEAGEEKLNVMKKDMALKKRIALQEWENKCLKLKFDHLKEDLHYIQHMKVTRTMLNFLKRKAKGLKNIKTPENLERQLEAMKKTHEKILNDWVVKNENIKKKIEETKRYNKKLDKMIEEKNVARCELMLKSNLGAEAKQEDHEEMAVEMIGRSQIDKQIEENNAQILAIDAELEKLAEKKDPAFPMFETLGDEDDAKEDEGENV